MRIGLIAVDSKHPNLALMKLSQYHKGQGDDVQWYDPLGEYDRVYMSKIFNFTPDYCYAIGNAKDVFRGGTGYSLTTELPNEVDRLQPDYSLYPEIDSRVSYGFLTRGCPNHCKWCVVPKKEGNLRPYMDIDEITLEGRRPKAVLMDNNILASDYGLQQIEKIAQKRYWVDFNQALDARLVTGDIARLLASVRWMDSLIRFGCDTPAQIWQCEKAIRTLMSLGYHGQFMLYCILMGDIRECLERLSYWKRDPELKRKIRVTAQPYRDPFVKAHPVPPPPTMAAAHGQMGQQKGVLHHMRIRRLPVHQVNHRRRLSRSLHNGRGIWPSGLTGDSFTTHAPSRSSLPGRASNAYNTYKTMRPKEFFIAVMNMRSWQATYFRTRSRTALNESKKYEKIIDAEIERVKAECPGDPDINPVIPEPARLPL